MNSLMNLETSTPKTKRTRATYRMIRALSLGDFRLVLERKNNLPSSRAAKQSKQNINETNETK